jgi:hypothetical protein
MSQSEAAQRWEERLQRFESSQVTVAQFCSDEGVSQPSYYHWRRRLRGPARAKSRQEAGGFIPVAFQANPPTTGAPASLKNNSAQARTIIELPVGDGGYHVRITVEVPGDAAQHRDVAETRS